MMMMMMMMIIIIISISYFEKKPLCSSILGILQLSFNSQLSLLLTGRLAGQILEAVEKRRPHDDDDDDHHHHHHEHD